MERNGKRGLKKNSQFDWNVEVSKYNLNSKGKGALLT